MATETFLYHGIVTEQDGTPIGGVKINVYDESSSSGTPTGLYLKTLQTDADGSYKIDLEYGTYKFVYSKDGYVSETKIYPQMFTLDVKLENITLQRNVAIAISTPNIATPPGSRRTIELMLVNIGTVQEEATLEVESPKGWLAQIRDADGEVLAVSLAPSSSKSLNLVVEIPVEASSSEIKITTRGRTTSVASLIVIVRGDQPSIITCEYPSKQRASGGIVEYDVNIHNPLPESHEVKLTLGGLPVDWEPMILNHANERVSSVYLSSDASVDLTLHIAIPVNATENMYQPYVEADIGGLFSRANLTLIVEHKVVQLGMVTMFPTQFVEQGKEAAFPIILENPGETDEVITLSTKYLPTRWQGNYQNSVGAVIKTILLQAGTKETVTLSLVPPFDVTPNNYKIQAIADSQTLTGNLSITVGIIAKMDMKLTMGNLYGQVTVGDQKRFELKLKNTGFSTISYPRLNAEPSVGSLSVETGPLDVKTIQPGEDVSFYLIVTALAGTPQGDYLIDVKAVSSEMQTETLQIRLTVQASSSQTLTVVIVIAAAIAMVFIVYRRFRRR